MNHLKFLFSGLFFLFRLPHKAIDFYREDDGSYALDQPDKTKNLYYLTMCEKGIKKGDRIELDEGSFLVKRVNYYHEPPEMFIALLERKENNDNL